MVDLRGHSQQQGGNGSLILSGSRPHKALCKSEVMWEKHKTEEVLVPEVVIVMRCQDKGGVRKIGGSAAQTQLPGEHSGDLRPKES